MKKSLISFIILFLVLSLCFPFTSLAAGTLQDRINQASKGDTITIAEGEYDETIVISKPITLVGSGNVVIRSCSNKPVIQVKGKDVGIKHIKVEQCGNDDERAAGILVSGRGHQLNDIAIQTSKFGLQLKGAEKVTIQKVVIHGNQDGNGIDLWKSNENILQENTVKNAHDGVYLEQSDSNIIRNNYIHHSRYGIHLMFSDNGLLEGNTSQHNTSGVMIMEAKNTTVIGNDLSLNNTNVHSQGMLFYHAYNSKIENNTIDSNRVGIFVEEADKNQFQQNELKGNFIGVQFLKSKENHFGKNSFLSNVNDAQAIGSHNNSIQGNYWDSSQKLDVNGSGESAIPYTADPFFLTLTNDVPEYQIFFQAPGMVFLQRLLKSPEESLLMDDKPLMEMTTNLQESNNSRGVIWLISGLMICGSGILFMVGRKQQ